MINTQYNNTSHQIRVLNFHFSLGARRILLRRGLISAASYFGALARESHRTRVPVGSRNIFEIITWGF